MNVADKLQQLAEMHRRGELTDAEFAMAKQATLTAPPDQPGPAPTGQADPFLILTNNLEKDLRDGVSAWVKYRLIMAVIGLICFLIMAMLMFHLVFSANQPVRVGPPVSGPGNLPGH